MQFADKPILKNKTYLYLTEFFAGMAVMAVELGASRLLAPFFSSSQIVWTIIIGTIMIAMALGNVYGGRSADKNPDPDRLYKRILIAAIWIAAIPVVGKYIVIGISAVLIFSINTNFLIWAAFAACAIIFVFPLFLLGTVTPSLARYTMQSMEESGKVVGTLGAFNTIGSIIGTFLPTFVTIPAVGTSVTFLIFGGIILVLALIYFFSCHTGIRKSAVSCLLFVLCCIFGHSTSFAFWDNSLTFEGESIYNYLQVRETDSEVILSTNVLFGVQSVFEKNETLTGMYYDYAMAAPLMAGALEKDSMDVLILGMGSGTYATQCCRYFDNFNIEGVEIDEKITDLAREYFELSDDIEVVTYDGRAYLDASEKTYDVIMVDAYQDITIPFQMSSVEFFSSVKKHLAKDGVMVVNLNMKGSSEDSIDKYLSDTISCVFPFVYVVDVPGYTNKVLYATDNADALTRGRININMLSRREGTDEKDAALAAWMTDAFEGIEEYEYGGRLLTDDKAPVELLGMRVLDGMISEEVQYYKDIYDRNGLQGLLDVL